MSVKVSFENIVDALKSSGLKEGDTLYLYTDLRTPGAIKSVKDQNEFCEIYYTAILSILGDSGTLVVPTYTTQVARYDIDFFLEETPSLMGLFTEYIRMLPESIRSIHPIHSLCAVGKNAEYICTNNGLNDFGWDSPFYKMLILSSANSVKIGSIGLGSGYAVGIGHFLEGMCDLPYVYNKRLKWRPYVNGVQCSEYYISSVRYLNLNVEYSNTRLVKKCRELGFVKSCKLGRSWVHISDYNSVFHEAAKQLRRDSDYLLAEPIEYSYGVMPFDGPTASKDDIASSKKINKSSEVINWAGFYITGQTYIGGDEEDL